MPAPDVWVIPINGGGPPVGFGLTGNGKTSQYSSGGNVWTVVDRPRQQGFLEFTAVPLTQLELPLVLDGADTDASVEPIVAAIASWIRPIVTGAEPPLLAVQGPVDLNGVVRWVATTIAWGDDQMRRRDGSRTRQDLTLTLIEHPGDVAAVAPHLSGQLSTTLSALSQAGITIPDQITTLIQQLPALLAGAAPSLVSSVTAQISTFLASIPGNPAGAATVVTDALPQLAQILPGLGGMRSYVFRDGDTLALIAARELGDYRKEDAIRALNGLRDHRSLVTGQRLLLP